MVTVLAASSAFTQSVAGPAGAAGAAAVVSAGGGAASSFFPQAVAASANTSALLIPTVRVMVSDPVFLFAVAERPAPLRCGGRPGASPGRAAAAKSKPGLKNSLLPAE